MPVRSPKGFAKNYFTLSAVQAYSTHSVLQRSKARVHAYVMRLNDECDKDETEEDDPGEHLCTPALNIPAHAGRPEGSALGVHCNCYYRRVTRNRIRQNPRPKLLISPYRLTNSAISPPSLFCLYKTKHTP
jgi:hypothetical protein